MTASENDHSGEAPCLAKRGAVLGANTCEMFFSRNVDSDEMQGQLLLTQTPKRRF